MPDHTARNQGIDVLRGLAALWVVLSHWLPFWARFLGPSPIIVPNPWGEFAVWLFFVISGFVIFATLGKSKSVFEFSVLRASRLYPVFWLSLLVATTADVVIDGRWPLPRDAYFNITMVHQFFGHGNFENVYWSLTVELAFYALAGVLLLFGLHRRPEPAVAAWLVCSCLWAVFLKIPGAGASSRDLWSIYLALDYAPYFACGVLFYRSSQEGWTRQRISLLCLAVLAEYLIRDRWGIAPMLAILAIFGMASTGRLRLLVSPVTLWLGAISYPLYLLHTNLGRKALTFLHAEGWSPIAAVLVTLPCVLALATAVHYFIEQPAMLVVRDWYSRWQRRGGG